MVERIKVVLKRQSVMNFLELEDKSKEVGVVLLKRVEKKTMAGISRRWSWKQQEDASYSSSCTIQPTMLLICVMVPSVRTVILVSIILGRNGTHVVGIWDIFVCQTILMSGL